MIRLQRIRLLVSVAAATALLSAPVALADEGHGDHGDRGRDGDEHAVVVQNQTTPTVDADQESDVAQDMNDDRDDVQAAPGQPQPVVDSDQEVNDLNDDSD